MTLTAMADDSGRRLDRILRKALPALPLSALHSLIRKGRVLVDGRAAGPEIRVYAGSAIFIPDEVLRTPVPAGPGAPLHLAGPAAGRGPDIIWEGADILILNKPAGLAVHGHAALNGDTLEDRVRAYLAGKLPPSLSFRPGPLHRLDKPASGIIVFSKTLRGAQLFSGFLREGKLRKRYLALLEGEPEKPALWEEMLVRDGISRRDLPPGGKTRVGSGPGAKQAVTAMTPLSAAKREGITLALLEIATGRTHQIRVQAASHGHPLWGDGKYGAKSRGKGRGGFFLHALSLEFPPPEQAGAAVPVFPRSAAAPLPEAFAETVKAYFDAGALRACEGIMAAPLFSDTIKYD